MDLLDEFRQALDQRPARDDGQAVVSSKLLLQAVEQLFPEMPKMSVATHDPRSSGTRGHLHLQAEDEPRVSATVISRPQTY